LKDLVTQIPGLSSTSPVFKYFQGLESGRKIQGLSRLFVLSDTHTLNKLDLTFHAPNYCAKFH